MVSNVVITIGIVLGTLESVKSGANVTKRNLINSPAVNASRSFDARQGRVHGKTLVGRSMAGGFMPLDGKKNLKTQLNEIKINSVSSASRLLKNGKNYFTPHPAASILDKGKGRQTQRGPTPMGDGMNNRPTLSRPENVTRFTGRNNRPALSRPENVTQFNGRNNLPTLSRPGGIIQFTGRNLGPVPKGIYNSGRCLGCYGSQSKSAGRSLGFSSHLPATGSLPARDTRPYDRESGHPSNLKKKPSLLGHKQGRTRSSWRKLLMG